MKVLLFLSILISSLSFNALPNNNNNDQDNKCNFTYKQVNKNLNKLHLMGFRATAYSMTKILGLYFYYDNKEKNDDFGRAASVVLIDRKTNKESVLAVILKENNILVGFIKSQDRDCFYKETNINALNLIINRIENYNRYKLENE